MSVDIKIELIIIESNKLQAQYLESIFDPDFFRITKIYDGKEAYDYLYTANLFSAVVLLSYQLPTMNGLEIMHNLKRNRKDYAFIFLTADKTVETAIEAMKSGAIDFLPKSTKLGDSLNAMVEKVYLVQQARIEQERMRKELRESEERMKIILNSMQPGILLIEPLTHTIIDCNTSAANMLLFSEAEIIGSSCKHIFTETDEILNSTEPNSVFNQESSLLTSKNQSIPILRNIVSIAIKGKKVLLVSFVDISVQKKAFEQLELQNAEIQQKQEEITAQRDELEIQRDVAQKHLIQIEKQNEHIKASIMYAKRIQSAILPPDEYINYILPEHTIFYLPRDIVSGDFYWVTQNFDNKILIAVGDCTGHGVQGAFMSMLGITFLNQIVHGKKFVKASDILFELRLAIVSALRQTGKSGEANDGMDIAICALDLNNNELQYAGANSSIYFFKKNEADNSYEFNNYKADKMPISIHKRLNEPFTNNVIQVKNGDTFYLASDGFASQFGGINGRKLLSKGFIELLSRIQNIPMSLQSGALGQFFNSWKGDYIQIDDVLVLGIRIKNEVKTTAQLKTDWSSKTILIADDETDNYMLLESMLEFTNAKIIRATNGREAVEMVKNNNDINLVLMDIRMPNMNGYEATQEIKQLNPELPVIVQTAFTQPGEKEKSFKAGCNDYITKPISEEDLFSTLAKYI